MKNSSTTDTTLDIVSLTDSLNRSKLLTHYDVEVASEFLNLPKLSCCHVFVAPDPENIDKSIWLQAQPAFINFLAQDGAIAELTTSVRFLWNRTHLFFYVEVEEQDQNDVLIDNECVWNGNNIEFLIAPRWHKKPLYDEYEFVFNRSGHYNDMHWFRGSTLEDSLKWNAEGLEIRFFQRLHINPELPGWSFQGRIPFKTFNTPTPGTGDNWRIGLFRKHYIKHRFSFLAWSPPLNNPPRFHTPERFGTLLFQ